MRRPAKTWRTAGRPSSARRRRGTEARHCSDTARGREVAAIAPSLRGAKRRSNPALAACTATGWLRSARHDDPGRSRTGRRRGGDVHLASAESAVDFMEASCFRSRRAIKERSPRPTCAPSAGRRPRHNAASPPVPSCPAMSQAEHLCRASMPYRRGQPGRPFQRRRVDGRDKPDSVDNATKATADLLRGAQRRSHPAPPRGVRFNRRRRRRPASASAGTRRGTASGDSRPWGRRCKRYRRCRD